MCVSTLVGAVYHFEKWVFSLQWSGEAWKTVWSAKKLSWYHPITSFLRDGELSLYRKSIWRCLSWVVWQDCFILLASAIFLKYFFRSKATDVGIKLECLWTMCFHHPGLGLVLNYATKKWRGGRFGNWTSGWSDLTTTPHQPNHMPEMIHFLLLSDLRNEPSPLSHATCLRGLFPYVLL